MDIESASMDMASDRLLEQVGTNVLKKGLDSAKDQTEQLLKTLEAPTDPSLGSHVDLFA
jgi:hypothetical protein